jgi:outer membrane protein TolC
MKLHRGKLGVLIVAGLFALGGGGCDCRKDVSELHFLTPDKGDYYKGLATSIDYPCIDTETPEEVTHSTEPHSLFGIRRDQVWDVSLAQTLQLALANNKVIRVASQFLAPGNGLLANPNNQVSIYDPALQETGVLFGNRGVEAALADFDAQWATSMLWGYNATIQNNAFSGSGVAPGALLTQQTGAFNSTLTKTFANGGQIQVQDVTNYLGTNAPVLFPSTYTGFAQVQYTQPLWAGSGSQYTRTAGPIGTGFTGVTGVSQGVVVARINDDIALADFEISVLNLLRDTENAYWDLYLSFRLFHTAVVAHNSALRSWREANAKLEAGGMANFKPVDEATSRDQLYATRAAFEQALSDLYTNETRLRRLIGLPVNDGRMMRPSDEPLSARYIPEWYSSLTEALTRRVELRRQKWTIKSLQLQLQAARSLAHPQLNFVSNYRVNMFGDDLISGVTNPVAPGSSALASMGDSGQTGWNLGFNLSMPIGFRQALTQIRNYEIRVAKAREGLATQELEIAHELATTFQTVSAQYKTAQSHFNRRIAAERAVQLYQAELEVGTTTLLFVLQAQTELANAERDYYTSIVNYNKGILDLNYRKGTLLDYNSISLAESEWTPDAYRDAVRHAWARSHAFDNKTLGTQPAEFAIPSAATGGPAQGESVLPALPGPPISNAPGMPNAASPPMAPTNPATTSEPAAMPGGMPTPAPPAERQVPMDLTPLPPPNGNGTAAQNRAP